MRLSLRSAVRNSSSSHLAVAAASASNWRYVKLWAFALSTTATLFGSTVACFFALRKRGNEGREERSGECDVKTALGTVEAEVSTRAVMVAGAETTVLFAAMTVCNQEDLTGAIGVLATNSHGS